MFHFSEVGSLQYLREIGAYPCHPVSELQITVYDLQINKSKSPPTPKMKMTETCI